MKAKRKARLAVELLEEAITEALLDEWPLLRNQQVADKLGINIHLANGCLYAMHDQGLIYQPRGVRTGWEVCDADD